MVDGKAGAVCPEHTVPRCLTAEAGSPARTGASRRADPVSAVLADTVPGTLDHRSIVISRFTRYAAASATALILAAGGVGVAYAHKSVTLSVDGSPAAASVIGTTVADLLKSEGISLGQHDTVAPSLESELSDGDTVAVRYGRQLTVNVDGVAKSYWTTATTVDAALQDLGLRTDGAVLSASRSAGLGREGLTLLVTTPKKITITVSGKKSTEKTTAPTVADVLKDKGITLAKLDRVTPALATAVKKNMKITVKRVVEKTVSKSVTVPFTTTKKSDSTMYVGQSKVEKAGKNGSKKVTEKRVIVDGTVESTKVLSTVQVSAPVAQVVRVGTKARPVAPRPSAGNTSGAGINLANAAMWDRIAQCESSGNWSINTGNGYYGGLQFSYSTWLGVGGADFAPRADLASRAEQITVANRLYAQRGLQPWGCAHAA